jgi:midasin (ATPase involved in ribosome maturation)
LKLNWLISLEIKYLIIKIIKHKNKINITTLKKELFNLLNEIYVKTNLISPGIIYTLVIQWISKINV